MAPELAHGATAKPNHFTRSSVTKRLPSERPRAPIFWGEKESMWLLIVLSQADSVRVSGYRHIQQRSNDLPIVGIGEPSHGPLSLSFVRTDHRTKDAIVALQIVNCDDILSHEPKCRHVWYSAGLFLCRSDDYLYVGYLR